MFGFEGPQTFVPQSQTSAPAFFLMSANPRGLATLRARFSIPPLAVSSSNTDDALNPDNYTLAGPSINYVVEVVGVDGDPNTFDLFLAAPFKIGTWTLSAKGITDANRIETL
jgi:hypothetical protein